MKIQELPLKEIFADPEFNCRGPISPFDVIDLSRSIEKHGLQQPIVVRPYNNGPYKWHIIMGHRRHMAFIVLKKETIPAIVKEEVPEAECRAMNLIENLQRKDLNVMQEARAISRFAHMTQDDIAKILNVSRGWVQVRTMALKLPEEVQKEIEAGYIGQENIRSLYSMGSKELMYQAVRDIKDARIRGDKRRIRIANPAKIRTNIPKVQLPTEIFAMQDEIRKAIGNNFGTRCLAWAAGAISSEELYGDVKKIAEEEGKSFTPKVVR